MTRDGSLLRPGLGALAALLLLGAPLGTRAADPAAAKASGLDPVVLQLKWLHQFQFAGYYQAVEQGYYREAGLDVKLREAVPGSDPVEQVLQGRADFGVGTTELALLRDKGKPVVVLADIYQHSPLILLARRQPGVDDLQALSNRPVMIEPLSAELFAYFRDEGVDPAKLTVREHSFDVQDLVAGKVDAMSAYSTDEPFLLKQAGVDFLTFTPRAGGIDFYGDNLFTTEEQIRRHPARVSAFRYASLRGWEYAMSHQAETVDLILRSYGRRKSREHLLFEARQTALLMHPELIEVGHVNPGRWRSIADTYADFGMLRKGFKLAGFLYDPNPRPDLTWLYIALASLALVALAALGWVLPLVRLNRGLRRARDAAEAADQAKGRYLAMMTHEVRTPLGGVIGLSDLLLQSALDKDQRENVALIQASASGLLRLSGDVLDYARIEAGGIQLERVPVPLAGLVDEQCGLFRALAQSKGFSLTSSVSSDVPDAVVTDPARLGQILSNLLSNAVKFTEKGGVSLTVEAEGPRILFRVSDTGIGIPADRIPRLFQVYSQAEASTPRRFGGTGLGLAIARNLARLLGGDVTVESSPGRGSTFTAAILAAAPDPSQAH